MKQTAFEFRISHGSTKITRIKEQSLFHFAFSFYIFSKEPKQRASETNQTPAQHRFYPRRCEHGGENKIEVLGDG